MVNPLLAAVTAIFLIVFIVIAINLGPMVIKQTASNVFNSTGTDNPAGMQENASTTSKTFYGMLEWMYPVYILLAFVLMGLGAFIGKKVSV